MLLRLKSQLCRAGASFIHAILHFPHVNESLIVNLLQRRQIRVCLSKQNLSQYDVNIVCPVREITDQTYCKFAVHDT